MREMREREEMIEREKERKILIFRKDARIRLKCVCVGMGVCSIKRLYGEVGGTIEKSKFLLVGRGFGSSKSG